ncbi:MULTISPECIES: NAD(P)H-binding protein [Kribbella]|nr:MULTISPECIES: NAD(P)H-binding protein [Kribbella]
MERIIAEKGQVMILVTGATGAVGREAIGVLRGRGAEVAAVTRDPSTAALPDGVHVVGADPSKPQTLSSALDGVEAVLLSPRAVSGATAELLSMAADRGGKRVVVLSAATVEYPVGQRRFVEQFELAEEAAKASGLAWTFLRSADFAANALAWAPQIRATGVVRGAYGDAATSPIHQRDIATVAADALLNAGHEGRSYVLTGPQSLNQYDKVRLIGQALGRELSFAEMPPEQVRQGMLAQGLPEEVPDRLLGSLADYALKPGPTTDTVQRLLGRPALSFAEWASENAAAFRN